MSGRRVRAAGFSGLAVLLAYTALSWTAWFRHWPTLLNVSVIVLEVLVIGAIGISLGIVLGQALHEALGDRRGIVRFGQSLLPMDEVLAMVALDFSNRGLYVGELPLATVLGTAGAYVLISAIFGLIAGWGLFPRFANR